jgi:phosphoribosylanthranilate isomerase
MCTGQKPLRVFLPVIGVKICGLTRVDEALACAGLGANWIGLNFHPGSPRYVLPADAAAIIGALPATASAVGVFVDRPAIQVAELATRVGITIVQLHGHEPPEDLLALGSLQVIRAFRLDRAADWSRVKEYLSRARVLGRVPDAVLVDAYIPGRSGGTGATVSDEVLDSIPPLGRLILAGGLTPDNVAERVARVGPWMVDVASGVEKSPGRKDLAKVAAFIRAARSVLDATTDRSLSSPCEGGARVGGPPASDTG